MRREALSFNTEGDTHTLDVLDFPGAAGLDIQYKAMAAPTPKNPTPKPTVETVAEDAADECASSPAWEQ